MYYRGSKKGPVSYFVNTKSFGLNKSCRVAVTPVILASFRVEHLLKNYSDFNVHLICHYFDLNCPNS